MGRYLCLEPVLPVAMCFHASRSAVTSALASPMVVKVKDAETKRNKASVAHTGWKKRTKTSTTTPKKVCLYSSSLQLLFQQKICKSASDRAAGKPHTPCDWASCVKERGLMRSSPTVLQSSLSFLSCFFFPVFSVVSSIL